MFASTSLAGFPVLTSLVLIPALGAILVAILPKRRNDLVRLSAILVSSVPAGLSLWLLASFDKHEGGFQFRTSVTWMTSLNIGWNLGVDGISLFLVVLTGFLFPFAILAIQPHHDPKRYYAWILLLETGCMGVFLSLDLFLFFICFEIVLVPMYFLIGGWGYGERVHAALKFFLFTMFGSALMLVAILALAFTYRAGDKDSLTAELNLITVQVQTDLQNGQTPDPSFQDRVKEIETELKTADEPTFDLEELAERRAADLKAEKAQIAAGAPANPEKQSWNPLHWDAAKWIFLAFALAFAVKVPLVPLHTWLPDAHTQAPTAGSVILAGVMLKLGTYGFIRFGLYLFPDSSRFFAPALVTLGVVGIIYGAVVAAMQKDLKRLVAYSSVAHLGFIVLGTFSLTTQGIEGGILQMVNHGISTGALFLLVGMIYERRHTREIAKLSGLQKSAPVLAAVFTGVMLSSIGLPGLNGFVGEFLVLTGSYLTMKWFAVVAAGGVILAALYLLWAYQRVFHGTPSEDDLATPDMTVREKLIMAPLLALIVFLGVYPKPMLDRIEPAVILLVDRIEETTDYVEPSAASNGYTGPSLTDGHGTDSHNDQSGHETDGETVGEGS